MRMGLRAKLMLSHSLPILLLVPLLGFYLFFNLRDLYVARVQEDLLRGGTILAATLQIDPELASDAGRMQQLVRLVDSQSATHIQAFDKDGVILGSAEGGGAASMEAVSQDPAVQTALNGQIWQGKDAAVQSDPLTVAIPVSTSGRVGAILLSFSLADTQATFARLQFVILSSTLAFSALSLIVGGILGSTLSQPLLDLATSTQFIVAGDYTRRVNIRSRDEVGELAANFNAMTKQLAEQRAAREQLLDDVAHELRGPIGALHAAIEFIRRGMSEKANLVTPLLDEIEQELSRLGRLTNRLNLAAPDRTNAAALDMAPLDVATIARRIIVLFGPEMEKNGLKLVSDLPPKLPLRAGNEDALAEVLTNLVENAMKFTPTGGQIRMSGGKEGQRIWIQVADTGMGLTVGEQTRLFQRFYRGDPSRPRPRGIGLGLAISKELVQLHHGDISVSSQVDRGTTFRVELPASS